MTELFSALWQTTESQLLRTVDKVDASNVNKRLRPDMRPLGVIFLHIAESQFMFVKTLFGADVPPFTPQTLGKNASAGDIANADELKAFVKQSCEAIRNGIAALPASAWDETVIAPWKAETKRGVLLGFVMGHSMQHVGQVIQALKYGE